MMGPGRGRDLRRSKPGKGQACSAKPYTPPWWWGSWRGRPFREAGEAGSGTNCSFTIWANPSDEAQVAAGGRRKGKCQETPDSVRTQTLGSSTLPALSHTSVCSTPALPNLSGPPNTPQLLQLLSSHGRHLAYQAPAYTLLPPRSPPDPQPNLRTPLLFGGVPWDPSLPRPGTGGEGVKDGPLAPVQA